jgi:hypothetical protein
LKYAGGDSGKQAKKDKSEPQMRKQLPAIEFEDDDDLPM